MGVLLYALDRYGGSGYVPDRYDGGDRQRHCTQRSSVVLDRYGGNRGIAHSNGRDLEK